MLFFIALRRLGREFLVKRLLGVGELLECALLASNWLLWLASALLFILDDVELQPQSLHLLSVRFRSSLFPVQHVLKLAYLLFLLLVVVLVFLSLAEYHEIGFIELLSLLLLIRHFPYSFCPQLLERIFVFPNYLFKNEL